MGKRFNNGFLILIVALAFFGCSEDKAPLNTSAMQVESPPKVSKEQPPNSEEPKDKKPLVLTLEEPLPVSSTVSIKDEELKKAIASAPKVARGKKGDEESGLDLLNKLDVKMSDTGEPMVGLKLQDKSEKAKQADLRNADPDSVGVTGSIEAGDIEVDP